MNERKEGDRPPEGAARSGSSRAGERSSPPPAGGFLETMESLAMAFVLALIIRGSVMEAYVIPTGSMAPTLLGRHVSLVCPNCGYGYSRGVGAYESAPDLSEVYCPSDLYPATVTQSTGLGRAARVLGYFVLSLVAAGVIYWLGRWVYRDEQFARIAGLVSCLAVFYLLLGSLQPLRGGDRILVNKLYYRFHEPRRWDVIVFKSPETIDRNFIKRLVAVPGDRVQILDGDVIVNGTISRKPEHVQEAVWQLVYDQDYPPRDFNRSVWEGPTGRYRVEPHQLVLLAAARGEQTLAGPVEVSFTRRTRNTYGGGTPQSNILDHCGYNQGLGRNVVGDLRLTGEFAALGEGGSFWVGLDHDEHRYRLSLRPAEGGRVECRLEVDGVVKDSAVLPTPSAGWHRVELSKVDYLLGAVVDGRPLGPVDLWPGLDGVGLRSDSSGVVLGAEGLDVSVRGLRIDRDVYYTGSVRGSDRLGGASIRLGPGEYFVLGDNSPDSKDGRDWRPPTRLYQLVDTVLSARGGGSDRQRAELLRYGLKAVPELLAAAVGGEPDEQGRAVALLETIPPGHLVPRKPGEDLEETLARWAAWWREQERAPNQVVPQKNLLGKPFLVFWPLSRVGLIR